MAEEKVNIGALWAEMAMDIADIKKVYAQVDLHLAKMHRINTAILRQFESFTKIFLSFAAFKGIVLRGIDKFAEREQDLLRLEAVLLSHGLKGKQVNHAYKSLAEQISKTTMYTTAEALAAERQLITMGILPSKMKEMMDATVQLASRTGDLERSATMIGQAAEGNTKAIGRLLPALKGLDKANMQTILDAIKLSYGDLAQKEVEGYIGQCKQLRKEYDSMVRDIGGFLVPTLTKLLKAYRNNPDIMRRITDPMGLIYAILNNTFREKDWTWSVGSQKDYGILKSEDKNFIKIKVPDKELIAELKKAWENHYKERGKEVGDVYREHLKAWEQFEKEQTDIENKSREDSLKQEKDDLEQYLKFKAEQINAINSLENKVMLNKLSITQETIQAIIALNPGSMGTGQAALGLKRIASSFEQTNIWSRKLLVDEVYYAKIKEAHKNGLVSAYDLELANMTIMESQRMANLQTQADMVIGNLEVFAGIAQMIYEASGDKTAFEMAKVLNVNVTILDTWLAAVKAYDIGEKVGGPYAELFAWAFWAIAVLAGMSRVMAIVNTQPGDRNIGNIINPGSNSYADEKAKIFAAPERERQVINWYVFDKMNTNADFAREILPYVQQAREDMVH